MVFSRALYPAECRASLRRLALYNLANGLSFAGVGETVMVLVAVRLGCPDAVSASLVLYLATGLLAAVWRIPPLPDGRRSGGRRPLRFKDPREGTSHFFALAARARMR